MDKQTNEKVINIFRNAENSKQQAQQDSPAIKFFAGVNYVRLDEDANGYPFNKKTLIENAESISYIIRVLKPKNGGHSLYNYNVPYDKLVEFISMFEKNELSGTIIDVDKYVPNELA